MVGTAQALVALGSTNRALAHLTRDNQLWQPLWALAFTDDKPTSLGPPPSMTPSWKWRFQNNLRQRRRRLEQLHRRRVLRLQVLTTPLFDSALRAMLRVRAYSSHGWW